MKSAHPSRFLHALRSHPTQGALTPEITSTTPSMIDSEIRRLALPALGSLLAEPLLVAIDAAMVGNLGTAQLAGLSLASTVLTTLVGLCIFLAYATTATTARLVGAGRIREALGQGVEGMWLAAGLGLLLGTGISALAEPTLTIFHPDVDVLSHATAYLHASAFGLPGMLLVLAATGTLRGLGNTTTALCTTTAGALLNIPLNFFLIYVTHLGVAGAGYGTATAQTLMAISLCFAVIRRARKAGSHLRPSGGGLLASLRSAGPLIVRTLCLRVAILLQIWVATEMGTVALASNQITMSIWNFAAYGLDALATAAQILVGQGLGSADQARVRQILARCLNRGLWYGMWLGLAIAAASPFIPRLMSADANVANLAMWTLWIAAAALPLSSLAYMLDGVLIGAGDARKLALYMLLSLLIFAPCALALHTWASGIAGHILLWAAYAVVFMAARSATMYHRIRTDTWMRIEKESSAQVQ